MDSDAATARAYDAAPYPDGAYFHAQPALMAGTARLYGLRPPDPETARTLELGCGSGGNLIALAERSPGATFLGIDLSEAQIAAGRARVARLGLTNVRLERRSIDPPDASAGPFDYVIAHGVYSWVPEAARAAILATIAALLAEDGVGYVSYNVEPGWGVKRIARDLMRLRAASLPEAEKTPAAREILAAYGRGVDGAYGLALRQEAETIAPLDDAYVRHEHLEAENAPCHFVEFVAAAQARGLRYLAEAEPSVNLLASYEPRLAERVRAYGLGDLALTEQSLDFFVGRQFRMSLLVREAAAARVRRALSPASLAGLQLLPRATFERLPPRRAELESRFVRFRTALDELAVDDPVQIGVLDAFERRAASAPSSLDLDALALAACGGAPTAAQAATVAEFVLELFRRRLIRLLGAPMRAAPVTARPRLRALALDDARAGAAGTTNLAHERVAFVDDRARAFALLLDGERDVAGIVAELRARRDAGTFSLAASGGPEPADVDAAIEAHVHGWLQTYARLRLLT